MQHHPMADPYSVPKRESTARITLPGTAPLTVTIFLGVSAARHSGYERLSDLFNGPLRFLPARDASDRMVFIQRDAVMVVSSVGVNEAPEAAGAAGPEDQAMPEDLAAEATTRASVEVILEDGSTLAGVVAYVLPQASRRLQDFLNTGERFFELRGQGMTHLVNKSRVASICVVPTAAG